MRTITTEGVSWSVYESMYVGSGVATGWTGVDMSTPLLLEVAPEIDTNPTSFYRGRGKGVGPPPDPRYRALAMSVHPTYFDLATPLCVGYDRGSCKNG